MFDFIELKDLNIINSNIYDLEYCAYWSNEINSLDDIYCIVADGKLIGFIDITIDKYLNGRKYGFINMIELKRSYRGMNLGKRLLLDLFNKFDLSSISGEALNSAIPYWYRIGGNFEMSDKKLLEYYRNGYSAVFKLTKRKLTDNGN